MQCKNPANTKQMAFVWVTKYCSLLCIVLFILHNYNYLIIEQCQLYFAPGSGSEKVEQVSGVFAFIVSYSFTNLALEPYGRTTVLKKLWPDQVYP